MFSEIYFVHREINYIVAHYPQVYINPDKILNNQIVVTYPVFRYGGIRLWDFLEFVTSEMSGNSPKIKHANMMTYYFYERTFSMPFSFHICHDNDCHFFLNCATRPNYILSDINFKNLELV